MPTTMKTLISALALLCSLVPQLAAQNPEAPKQLAYSDRFSLMFGLIQPVALAGFNVEVNYATRRLMFDYSHGVSLDPPVVGAYKDHGFALHLPFSTGFGIGYRFNSFLDLRFEPKLHSWEVYADGDAQVPESKILDFKTFTLGLGLYYRYMPFKKSESKFLQGITTSTSLRYWQNVGTTLSKDAWTHRHPRTNLLETLKAPNIGMANTPIIFNIAVGYTFGGK